MGESGTVARGKVADAAANGSVGRPADSPLDRVLHALGHPVRRQILRSLVRRDGSASTISKELELDLSVVSYHLNQVLARECGVPTPMLALTVALATQAAEAAGLYQGRKTP